MTSYKASQEELRKLSRYVYDTFQDIEVTSHMIHWRRRLYLLWETVANKMNTISGGNVTPYIVGSQSEGSTTVGMQSDTDR